MATEHTDVEALIQGIQLSDARLYQILSQLNRGLMTVQEEVFPLVLESQRPPTVVPILEAPSLFNFIFTPLTVRFFWNEILGASSYEVRNGSSWDTATFMFRTNSLQADIDPVTVGTHTYLIKTLNGAGEASTDSNSLVVVVPELGSITVTVRVIDNNVLLGWPIPATTFRILHYAIDRSGVWAGNVDATFFSFFENVAGFYTYGVTPVDVAGNRGPRAEVTVEVNTPPDYSLQDTRVSNLMGTRVNVIRTSSPSLLCCWADQTWQEHFVSRSWNTIQDQLNAHYPIYIQPGVTTGSYEEVVDYGAVIQNTIATITYNQYIHAPNTTVTIKLASSTDNVTYTPFIAGASLFIPTMRFLKVRLEFVGSSDAALLELYGLTFSLDVKRENDGGSVLANYLDAGGTQVNFTKEFKDIESITCSTQSITEPYYVIFDFVDIPDPKFFKVYVFDSTGNRVSKQVDWKARGIV